MRDHSIPNGLCSMDPITLGMSALAGAIPALMGGGGSNQQQQATAAPTPEAPPPQAPPQRTPTGQKKSPGGTPSFLGSAIAPPTNTGGGKTLLGQ